MSNKPKLKVRFTTREYFNPTLASLYETLPPECVETAIKVVDFIKKTYPSTKDVLNGDLIYESSWNADPKTGEKTNVEEFFYGNHNSG